LTSQVSTYLDVHFLFPMLDFLSEHGACADVNPARLELFSKTKMVDAALKLVSSPSEREQWESKRSEILAGLNHYRLQSEPVRMAMLNEEKDLSALSDSQWQALFQYAKVQYECGNYEAAHDNLKVYVQRVPQDLSAMWGKLASDILLNKWEEALQDLHSVMDLIDNKDRPSHLEQLQQRTWLLHWSLFIFAFSKESRDSVVDFMLQPRCLEAIQINSPWLLRYLTAGVVAHKRRRSLIRDLNKILKQEKPVYQDPLTEFVESLSVQFDFDVAEVKLRESEGLLSRDFFLYDSVHECFMERARVFMFETYCRIHQNVDISYLAKKLSMDATDAERWVVEMIRDARLDAKINSKDGIIIMSTTRTNAYQKIVDKTRELAARTFHMASQLDQSSIKASN